MAQVAISLRHAALLTHKGEMYTWGHGAGGKLGQGNNEDADSPLRVYTLWGKNVKHIACGGEFWGTHVAVSCSLTNVPGQTLTTSAQDIGGAAVEECFVLRV